MIDVVNKRFCILGPPGTGKSELAKHLLRQTSSHVVYDPLGEHSEFTRYVPSNRNSISELEVFIMRFVIPQRPRLFLVDEANRYIRPKPSPLPAGISDLNDLSRHWDITWGLLARRAVQMHSDVLELAHYLFVFRLQGRNDRRFFNDTIEGLGHIIAELPEYHFAVIEKGQRFFIHNPFPVTPTP